MRTFIIPALCAVALFGMSFQANAATVEDNQPQSAAQIMLDGANEVHYDIMYEGNGYNLGAY